jgi:hypothetical protein
MISIPFPGSLTLPKSYLKFPTSILSPPLAVPRSRSDGTLVHSKRASRWRTTSLPPGLALHSAPQWHKVFPVSTIQARRSHMRTTCPVAQVILKLPKPHHQSLIPTPTSHRLHQHSFHCLQTRAPGPSNRSSTPALHARIPPAEGASPETLIVFGMRIKFITTSRDSMPVLSLDVLRVRERDIVVLIKWLSICGRSMGIWGLLRVECVKGG